MRFKTKEQLIELINSIESDEIYTLNIKSQVRPIEIEVVYECYRQNGALDLLDEDDYNSIKQDVKYCNKTYLNINSACKTLLIW